MIIDESVSELDRELCLESSKPILNKDAVDRLIEKGANINVVVYSGDSLLMQLIKPDDDNDKNNDYYETIKYLIQKGIDLDYINPDYGFNCLFHAELSFRPEIFQLLVDSGIYLNNIAFDHPSSIFDDIYSDLIVFTDSPHYTKEEIENLNKILWIIEDNNAKQYHELETKKLNKFLIVGDFFEYGLLTYDGKIRIEDITNDEKLITEFNEWITDDWSPYYLCRKVKHENMPLSDFKKHIAIGFELCNRLKSYLNSDIKFTLYSINFNDFKNNDNWRLNAYEI